MKRLSWTYAVLAVLGLCALARADVLILKDGSKVEGTVIPSGSSYWVKLPDGSTRMVPMDKVEKLITGAVPTDTPQTQPASGTSADFSATKRKADALDVPDTAVAMWQKFLSAMRPSANAEAAKAELAKWKTLADSGSERINGKWVTGDERKALAAKAKSLADEAYDLEKQNHTLQAMKKLEEAVRIYPNSYTNNALLGFLALTSGDSDAALRYFQQCQRLDPDAAGPQNNLAIVYYAKRQHERAIQLFLKAVEIEDNKALASNLMKAVQSLPKELRNAASMKSANDAAKLLASKYGIDPNTDWREVDFSFYMSAARGSKEPRPYAGGLSSGTGFVIRDDGLILTNRHVVSGAKSLKVIMPDGTEKPGDIVVIDEAQDLALVQIKSDAKLPLLQFAKASTPGEGAQCFVMGFPMIDRMGATVKITQGIVSGTGRPGLGADIVIDAKVNPGNSGGPLLDSHGAVIGIVSMKSASSELEDSYGLAISAGHIRDFLAKNKVTTTPAEAKGDAMTAEQVATAAKPATVCILARH